MEGEQSNTAISAAVSRGLHRLYDEPPWVLDDPFALLLAGPIWRVVERRNRSRYPEEVARAMVGGIVGRSRYTEERLAGGGHSQFVLLGAGLDSFGWRRPDLSRKLQIFEVDHPASQEWKRQRAMALGLPDTPTLTYVPVDFEVQDLRGGLDPTGFDWTAPAFVSCLGVTMYLTSEAIADTLGIVAACCPGSEIVFTYAPADEHLDEVGRQFDEISGRMVAEVGEPILTRLSRDEVEAMVHKSGLEVVDHPDHAELVRRYFSSRRDGLRPYTSEGIIAARVPR